MAYCCWRAYCCKAASWADDRVCVPVNCVGNCDCKPVNDRGLCDPRADCEVVACKRARFCCPWPHWATACPVESASKRAAGIKTVKTDRSVVEDMKLSSKM